MKNKNQLVIEYLQRCVVNSWKSRIEYGLEYNLPIGVEVGKTDFEALSCVFFGIKGTGKSSGDNDHNNGDETKGASKVRPKNCVCGKICHYFQETCDCGSKEFTYSDDKVKTDARWGIDTKAHFKYNVPNYHLWIVEAQEYNANNRIFFLTLYSISGDNKIFNDILKVQNQSSSKNKNFIPYSKDFYASNPKMMAKYKIVLPSESEEVQITVEPIEQILITKEMMMNKQHIKKYLPESFFPSKDTYLYDEIEPILNVDLFKTAHGKDRGQTNRRSK